MTTEHDPRTRIVLSWLREDAHENAERVLLRALDEVDATPQRRSWWPARRTFHMNKFATTAATLAAVLVLAVIGYTILPGLGVLGPGASPTPSAAVSPTPGPDGTAGTWWPQTTLQEVREAQGRADAGDPDYTWQVEPTLVGDAAPWDAEILDRFAREALGWEEFQTNDMYAYGDQGSFYTELVLFRCAPGLTNPLYPDDPRVGDCAPTIDDFRYETVMLTIEQPVRRSPTGIWVVTEWKELQPRDATTDHFQHFYYDLTFGQVAQVAPPSDTEAIQLMETFLAARIGGSGAEQLVHEHAADPEEAAARFVRPSDYEVPVLYATSRGAAYERSEIERLAGPVWPTGHIVYRVRLFAEDGVVVEQSIAVIRLEDGGVGLMYHPYAVDFPTTEDGQPVPIPYTFLDGEVSFSAAVPWDDSPEALYLGNPGRGERLDILADPLTAVGCEPGPAPADAAALAESIRANPDLEATDPVSVSIGGIAALQMDVTAANGARLCPQPYREPLVLFKDAERPWAAGGEDRLRLYLLDMPAGSAQMLAIVVAAPQSEFDRVIDAATPVIESIRFDLP